MYAQIIDKNVYHTDEISYGTSFECDHDEQGWYVELSFSDGGYDVYGPYITKEDAINVF